MIIMGRLSDVPLTISKEESMKNLGRCFARFIKRFSLKNLLNDNYNKNIKIIGELMKRALVLCLIFLVAAVWADEVYFLNSMSQTLSYYNTQTEELDNSFCELGLTTGSAPNKLAESDGILYAVITYENSIQKINSETGESLGYIYLENSSAPNDICIVDGFAYVSGNNSYKLYKINLSSGDVVADVQVGTAPEGVFQVGINIWVANAGYDIGSGSYDPGTVSVINPVTMEVVRTVSTGLNPRNGQLINGMVHVTCSGDFGATPGRVDLIAPDANEAEIIIELGGTPASIGYHEGRVYVGHNYPANMHVYDAVTYEILATPADGYFSGGAEFGFSGDLLYIIDPGDYVTPSWARVYNTSDYSLADEFQIGVGATDLLIVPSGSSSSDDVVELVTSFGNYPNPFNPSTTISFSLNTEITENLEIQIYNLKGQVINEFVCHPELACPERSRREGQTQTYSTTWNGTDQNKKPVSSGIYFAVLKYGNQTIASHKMMLMK